jgi:hypothetical protein
MDCAFCQLDRSLLAESELSRAFLDGFPVSAMLWLFQSDTSHRFGT